MSEWIRAWSGELIAMTLVAFIGIAIAAVQWFSGVCHG